MSIQYQKVGSLDFASAGPVPSHSSVVDVVAGAFSLGRRKVSWWWKPLCG